MIRLKISDIFIEFPHVPYKAQLITMTKMINAFKNNKSAIIESPTGTGKSFSIICAALGYLNYERAKIKPANGTECKEVADVIYENDKNSRKKIKETEKTLEKIFICSRTHKQLDQLVNELKKTNYQPNITILGSREQYCINPKLENVKDLDTACKNLIERGTCNFFKGKEKLKKIMENKTFDIEELKVAGKSCIGCPYYVSKELIEKADIVFAPYNYIIDSRIRKAMGINLANSIVIIDEAHNLEDTCRSSGSLEITSMQIDIISNDLIKAVSLSNILGDVSSDFSFVLSYIVRLKDFANSLQNAPIVKKESSGYSSLFKGKGMLDKLNEKGFGGENWIKYKASISRINEDKDGKNILNIHTARFLEELETVFNSIFHIESRNYAFAIRKINSKEKKSKGDYSFNFWLLQSGSVFNEISLQSKSVVLLSGTLTPFEHLSDELNYKFEYSVVAPHILKPSQVFVASISKGSSGIELCGKYDVAETSKYQNEISNIIISVSNGVKNEGGTLVFFPSYSFLNNIFKILQQNHNIKNSLVIEPQIGGNRTFEYELNKYKKLLNNKNKPAIMLCVYRGKASEGINFKDDYARAVIAVGIPYPSIKDPLINLKMEWNDKNFGIGYGRKWYGIQAFKALKQALGRTIRHCNDWSVLYLVDSRFTQPQIFKELPDWVQQNIRSYSDFSESKDEMEKFVENKRINRS